MRSEWMLHYRIASRGGGKTLMSAADVHKFAKENENCHIAIASDSFRWARNVLIEGPRGLLKTSDPENPAVYQPSKRRVVWPKTGAQATIFTYGQANQLRGLILDAIWG